MLDSLDDQDLSRFSEQDLILETDTDIQKYLPDVLGQALARTWVDKRFLDAFFNYPVEILERGGVYLPEKIQLEFSKEEKSRPKVTVFERTEEGRKKVLELKLIMAMSIPSESGRLVSSRARDPPMFHIPGVA